MGNLTTERLHLRPFAASDWRAFHDLAGDWGVARMTSDIPHPLTPEVARKWMHRARGERRLAIVTGDTVIGGVGYFRRRSGAAELGFWLGRPWWGQGFTTEAARAVIEHGFSEGLPAFASAHFLDNPASGRVLAKLGFVPVERTTMWCEARGNHVEAITYWLDRRVDGGEATARNGGWRRLLDSWSRFLPVNRR
jgi:[ribosomal protein S5]-alanine N-acetyltransferase